MQPVQRAVRAFHDAIDAALLSPASQDPMCVREKELLEVRQEIADRFAYLAQHSTAPGAWRAAMLEVSQIIEERMGTLDTSRYTAQQD